jgi:type IX secretion system PorP/SprF family membrane protein
MICLKKILFLIIVVFSYGLSSGQQVPMYSQYIMNGFLINPSIAGRDGYTTANITARDQWIGIKGGPKTYAASFQTSLLENSFISRSQHVRRRGLRPSKPGRVGLGGYVFSDNNGIIRRTGFQADYAYHIPVGTNRDGTQDNVSLGLGLILYQYAINTSQFKYSYADDPYLNSFDKSVFITDFNFGASYITAKYYLGFSMTNILRGSLIFANNSDSKIGEQGNYFLTGGFNIPIDRDWSIKPSAFIKSSDMLLKTFQFDLTTRVFYQENYWGGVSYRFKDAIILLLGVKYDKYYIGFAFDYALTQIRKRSIGSMELTLAVKFGENARRYKWLNSF